MHGLPKPPRHRLLFRGVRHKGSPLQQQRTLSPLPNLFGAAVKPLPDTQDYAKGKRTTGRVQGIMAKTSPAEFINQVRAEARKVVWPSREETIRTAIFVFILMLILSLFFLAVDSAFGAVVRWVLNQI